MASFKKALLAFLFSFVSVTPSIAVTVTIEDPGVWSANPAAFGSQKPVTETFDGIGTGHFSNYASDLGTYSAGRVDRANQYGGAGASQYLFSQAYPGTLLTLNQPATYFGLWWSAGSVGNRVDLIRDGVDIFSFNTDDVLAFLREDVSNGGDYYGNPTARFAGRVRHEPFLFINLFSDKQFDAVRLAGRNFESDNHTVAQGYMRETGTDIAPIPLPPAMVLLLAALGALGLVAKRARS